MKIKDLLNAKLLTGVAVLGVGAPEVVEAYDEVKNSPVEKVSKSLPIEETGNGDILFREMYTGRWFHSNLDAVEQAIRRFKDRFDNGNTLCMNDFYQEKA